MNTVQILILILLVSVGYAGKLNAETEPTTQTKRYVSIMWIHYHLIEIAMAEVKKMSLNVEKHRIGISEMEKTFLVVFSDPEPAPTPPGVIPWGNQGKMPAFEVEISKADLKVIRSNFIK